MRSLRGLAAVLVIVTTRVGVLRADPDVPASQPAELSAAEASFQRQMTHAVLVGQFTLEGEKNPAPHDERYGIESVKKLKGDLWLFDARIQYGSHDVNVPLVLPVRWAGDTAVISLTDMGIPLLGTFTARVVIYDNHYAGIWSGGPTHRGTLSGKIVHEPPTTNPSATRPSTTP